MIQIAHANRALAFQNNAAGARIGAHIKCLARHGGVQKAARGGDAPAALNGALEITNTGLIAAIVIWVARNAGSHATSDEGFRERVEPIHIRYGNTAIASAPFLAKAKPAFGAHVIGQAIRIAPAAIAALRPAILIPRLAAIINHAIDGG